ncbi:MAG: hypothetical protein ACRC2J_12640, partial [Microcoleaceae cyanobacterium]
MGSVTKKELTGQNASTPITISGNINGKSVNTTLPVTSVAPQLLQVEEGSTTDIQPVTPQVSITQAGNATEVNTEPGKFVVNLNAPAPDSGLVINYSLSGSAKQGGDYIVEQENKDAYSAKFIVNSNSSSSKFTPSSVTINELKFRVKNLKYIGYIPSRQGGYYQYSFDAESSNNKAPAILTSITGKDNEKLSFDQGNII